MTNLNIIETFRTKDELINYFKAMGKNITEEEIEQLKQSYTKEEENSSTLTLQQLDNVVGGVGLIILANVSEHKDTVFKLERGKTVTTVTAPYAGICINRVDFLKFHRKDGLGSDFFINFGDSQQFAVLITSNNFSIPEGKGKIAIRFCESRFGYTYYCDPKKFMDAYPDVLERIQSLFAKSKMATNCNGVKLDEQHTDEAAVNKIYGFLRGEIPAEELWWS